METIIDGININVIKELTLWFCTLHAQKAGTPSTPHPSIRQFKRYFIANVFDFVTYLLIIRVILTTEDDGFLLVSLDFALLDEFFFLCTDALQQDGSRLVVWVLWYKLAMNGEIEDFGFGGCYYGK